MPGIGDEIEGAMQQAPQPERHSMKNDSTTKDPKYTKDEGSVQNRTYATAGGSLLLADFRGSHRSSPAIRLLPTNDSIFVRLVSFVLKSGCMNPMNNR